MPKLKELFCIQGSVVYETGVPPAGDFPNNCFIINAHVCDGCRDHGGEIHIGMIDDQGQCKAIVFSPVNAAVVAANLMEALSKLPDNILNIPAVTPLPN